MQSGSNQPSRWNAKEIFIFICPQRKFFIKKSCLLKKGEHGVHIRLHEDVYRIGIWCISHNDLHPYRTIDETLTDLSRTNCPKQGIVQQYSMRLKSILSASEARPSITITRNREITENRRTIQCELKDLNTYKLLANRGNVILNTCRNP